MVKKFEYFLFFGGIYIFEIWYNLLNVSVLDIEGRIMKKKKIYENRQMNLGSLFVLGEKSYEIVVYIFENIVYVFYYIIQIFSLLYLMKFL